MMPGLDQIKHPQNNIKNSPNPLPKPGNDEYDYNEGSRNEMDQERQDGFPPAEAFAKDIDGKQAQEECKGDAQNPR
jgi:hypothetical protein